MGKKSPSVRIVNAARKKAFKRAKELSDLNGEGWCVWQSDKWPEVFFVAGPDFDPSDATKINENDCASETQQGGRQ